MQDVDRPGHIQALSHPTRQRRARVEHKPFRFILRSHRLHRIAGHFRTKWDLGEQLAVRPPESQLSVRVSIDLIALLMDGSMVPSAEHREI